MTPPSAFEAYSEPAVYDIVNTPGTAREVDFFERIAARFILGDDSAAARPETRRLHWFEPACGSGRYLRVIAGRMARRGVGPVSRPVARHGRITGLDLSAEMLDFASERVPARARKHAHVIHGDMRRIPAALFKRKVDFAFCPHNSVRHLQTERDLVAHLRSVAEVLSRRGVYAVGLELTAGESLQPTEAVFRASRGSTRIRQLFSYLPPALHDSPPVETVIISTEIERTIRGRRSTHHHDTSYPLRSWTVPEWHAIVRRSGLEEIGVSDIYAKPLRSSYTRYANRILRRSRALE